MNIRETFRGFFRSRETATTWGELWLKDLIRGGMKGDNFLKNIYQDKILTPHEEMWECEKIYRENAFVVSAIQILKDIILGNKLSVETDDEATREWWERYFENTKFKQALGEAIENFLKVGNGYIEKVYNGRQIPSMFYPVARAWAIWILKEGKRKRYIEELPKGYRGENVQNFKVSYSKYDIAQRMIRGIEYKNPLLHLKYGISHVPEYGRSPLASAINDATILKEIERAMAVISRYKAIPRKLLNLKNHDGTGVNPKVLQNIIEYLNSLSDMENPVIGGVEADVKDLSYSSAGINFSVMIDYLKRKLTSAFAPDFYVHGDITTYAVALEQKNLFYLRVMAIRQMIAQPINEMMEEIRTAINLTPRTDRDKDFVVLHPATIKFGEFDFDTKAEERINALNMWNAGLITLNEARVRMGLDEIEDEMGEAYKWELSNVGNAELLPLIRAGGENGKKGNG